MEDLAEKINSVLSDPESVKQLGEIAQMLGFSPENMPSGDEPQQPAPDVGALMELAGKLKNASAEDDNIRFLNALRPLLSEEKQPRLDKAVRLLKIINLLPIIRDSGILGGDLLGVL